MMNRRTFLRGLTLGIISAPLVADAQQTGLRSSVWSAGPRELGAGVSFLVIEGNPSKTGPFILHARFPPGHTVGPHTHPSAEHITVLSGTVLIGWGQVWDPAKFKAVPAGEDLLLPAGKAHFAAFPEQTVMEVRAVGPWEVEYILDADDPR